MECWTEWSNHQPLIFPSFGHCGKQYKGAQAEGLGKAASWLVDGIFEGLREPFEIHTV